MEIIIPQICFGISLICVIIQNKLDRDLFKNLHDCQYTISRDVLSQQKQYFEKLEIRRINQIVKKHGFSVIVKPDNINIADLLSIKLNSLEIGEKVSSIVFSKENSEYVNYIFGRARSNYFLKYAVTKQQWLTENEDKREMIESLEENEWIIIETQNNKYIIINFYLRKP